MKVLGAEHEVGAVCDECVAPYPLQHSCGGYLHVETERTEDDWDMALVKCDTCDYSEYGAICEGFPQQWGT